MAAQPNKPILDREKVEGILRNELSEVSLLWQDVVDYGTHLIPRAFTSSPRGLEDVVVICVLLKQFVQNADAIEILLSKGALQATKLPVRTMLEASLFISWILLGDSVVKARHYYVSNLRRLRLWPLRLLSDTSERERFSPVGEYLDLGAAVNSPDVQAQAQQELDQINGVLSQPSYIDINAAFEKHVNLNRPDHEPAWYMPLGKQSLRQIAEELQRLPLYEMVYSPGSQYVHSSSYRDHVSFSGQGDITLHPIRDLLGLADYATVPLNILLMTYRSILRQYRPGELSNFARKYANDWRSRITNVRTLDVDCQVDLVEI